VQTNGLHIEKTKRVKTMSDLIIEVDEAMKQERLEKLWKEYGGILISFLLMLILATAANAGYHAWIQHRNYKQTNIYMDVLAKDNPSADDLLAILPQMTDGMKSIVSLRAAGIALENGNTEKALTIYRTIDADETQKEHNPMLSTLAKYIITGLDKDMSLEDKIKNYETLASDINNPWRYNALLDAALLQATQNKDYSKARGYLAKITGADSIASKGMKQKAQSLDILYQAQQNENK
jgi:hypothetical protein